METLGYGVVTQFAVFAGDWGVLQNQIGFLKASADNERVMGVASVDGTSCVLLGVFLEIADYQELVSEVLVARLVVEGPLIYLERVIKSFRAIF